MTRFGTDSDTELDLATNLAQVVSAVVGTLAQIVVQGILTVVVSRAVLGQDVTMAEAWARARPRLGRLVVMSVAVLLLMVLLLGIPIALGFAVAAGGAGDDRGIRRRRPRPGRDAAARGLGLRVPRRRRAGDDAGGDGHPRVLPPIPAPRARGLVAGVRRPAARLVIAQVLGGIIQVPFALASVFTSVTDGEPPGFLFYVLNVVGSSLAGTITYPFVAGVVALVYVDLRIRREGLDLTLARAAGVQHPSTVAYSAAGTPPRTRRRTRRPGPPPTWSRPRAVLTCRRRSWDVPVVPGRDAAREAAHRELLDPGYRAHEPSIWERIAGWVLDHLKKAFDSTAGARPAAGGPCSRSPGGGGGRARRPGSARADVRRTPPRRRRVRRRPRARPPITTAPRTPR